MSIRLDDDRRAQLAHALQGFFLEEFDEELSPFRAEQILDFVLGRVGPPIYNQAVQDARGYLQTKLDELDGEVYAPWV
jgi:uncharacterized protein (DUF2164 family)